MSQITGCVPHEDDLTRIAQARRPRVGRWWGVRGGGTRKHAECYLCDAWIDTWAAKWPAPKHVDRAIREHAAEHAQALTVSVELLTEEGWEPAERGFALADVDATLQDIADAIAAGCGEEGRLAPQAVRIVVDDTRDVVATAFVAATEITTGREH